MERRVIELHLAGASCRQICIKLKAGHRKVRRILAMAEAAGYLSGTALPSAPLAPFAEPPPSVMMNTSAADKALLVHREWIEERLKFGWSKVTAWEECPTTV